MSIKKYKYTGTVTSGSAALSYKSMNHTIDIDIDFFNNLLQLQSLSVKYVVRKLTGD